jgi:molybdopterin/thiamine biosynthesis adenylyltransferase
MNTTDQRSRFKDAPWLPKQDESSIIIGGAGGIGSWLNFFLTKIGYKTIVYDFDTIEEHNLGGQLFRQDDIGNLKVRALQRISEEFCSTFITTFEEAVSEHSMSGPFMFSAFDNMRARAIMFNNWKKHAQLMETLGPSKAIFIDGRLEIEQLQVFCVTPKNIERYEKYLFADSRVADAPCTMKQSSHTAAMIGTLMTSFFTNHMTNIYAGEELREVPFFHEFIVPINLTTTEP